MELRQLRYFVRVAELGSISRAALDLGLVQSALSQQISRLEGELCIRLLQRGPRGVTPAESGLAYFREAQLVLRHADQAVRAAQHSRPSGSVSVGMAPTTTSVIGVPLLRAMRERYPNVRLHLVESLSGHLTAMLNARQLDLAVLFNAQSGHRWSTAPLLEEKLFLIQSRRHLVLPERATVRMSELGELPLILPTGTHGLRSALDSAFARVKIKPMLVAEIDSLAMLMDAVSQGFGSTLQPAAAVSRFTDAAERFHLSQVTYKLVHRINVLCSLSDDELSPPRPGGPRSLEGLRHGGRDFRPVARDAVNSLSRIYMPGAVRRGPAITIRDAVMPSGLFSPRRINTTVRIRRRQAPEIKAIVALSCGMSREL